MAAKSPLKELLCGICHDDLLAHDGAEIGELECPHRFCYPCITKWAEIENSCPFCKQRFARLRRKRLAPRAALAGLDPSAELPGVYLDTQEVEQRNQRVAFEDPQFQQWLEEVACLVCGGGDDEAHLLLCDECDRACHTFCAGLQEIPAGEWFCPQCQQRRGRARQRRRQPAGRPAATGRRRRAEADVVLVESSQESEEGEGRRPAQRRRTAAGGRRARGAGGGASRAADDDLSDFVVPDESEEDSDWLAEYGPSEPARSRSAGARGRAARGGAAAARAQRGARPQRSARRQRQAASSGGSDESTHDRFQDSEPEADYTDSETSGSGGAEQEDERPLLARLRRRQGAQPSGGSRRAGRSRGRAAAAPAAAAGRPSPAASSRAPAEGLDAPTHAHRNVAALAASWDDLRQGSTTFAELRRSGSAGSGRSSGAAAPAQPPRRRLVRAGALGGSADGGGGGSAAGRAASTDEIVDLLDSPSPGLLRSGRAGAAAAGAAAANDEQLAWQAMQAALEEGGDQQRQRGRARQWRAVQSPAGGGGGKDEDEDEELDLPLAVRYSRGIAAARQRGSRFVPRRQQQEPQQQQAAAPPSTGGRTVRDMRLMAAAARGGGATPGSGGRGGGGGGAGRPAILIPRMRGFEDAAPGGQSAGNGNNSGRGPMQYQQHQQHQQQQQQQRNPFVRFQCSSGGSGAGSGRAAGGGRGDGARRNSSPQPISRDPARPSSPRPLHHRNSPPRLVNRSGPTAASGDFSFATQQLQQRPYSPGSICQQPALPGQQHQQHMGPSWRHQQQNGAQAAWQSCHHQQPLLERQASPPQRLHGQPAPRQPPTGHQHQRWAPLPNPSDLPNPQQQQQGQQAQQPARPAIGSTHAGPPGSWGGASPGLSPSLGSWAGSEATPGASLGGTPASFSFQDFQPTGNGRQNRQEPPPGQQQPGGWRPHSAPRAPAGGAAVPWQQQPPPAAQPPPHAQLRHQQHATAAAPALPAQHAQQQAQQAQQPQQAPQQRTEQLSKMAILDRLKPLLKQHMQEGLLNRETYKQAAKASVASLFEAQQSPGWQGLSDSTAQAAVAEAVQQAVGRQPS